MLERNPEKIVEKVKNDYNLITQEWDLSRSRLSRLKLNFVSEVRKRFTVRGNGR